MKKITFQIKIGIGNSTSLYPPKYFLQIHENGESPHLYIMDQLEQIQWVTKGGMKGSLRLEFGHQTETTRLKRANYPCNEDNSNSFMNSMDKFYSKKLGCILPWTPKVHEG